ncbi:sensor histidine kinase response [Diplodia corticola]|uniref:histidine kinase n=1 Tax=Diplodia corticola TaxID=236234 RepID=A0A1J9S9F6_9PEZI|nr:sensor histidine kinase response [Diplodia corticola]OJD36524.1 sensor histidine kinase response [Diplodia corticola]
MTTTDQARAALLAERARERHVFSYYPPSLRLPDLRPSLDAAADRLLAPELDPRPSSDAALSAFAQLGVHRLNAKRAFISLIDSQSQFVLAEATKTVPLGNPSVRRAPDPLWLGCAIIPRAFGACQCALATDALVIEDTQLDSRFTDLPFATTAPDFRFYAGVPLKSPQGPAIGVYCIIDDAPRHGLGDHELLFMQDMAATVVSYLSAARAQDTNRKAEQMIRGLNSFVTGAADLQASQDLDVPQSPVSGSPNSTSHHSPHKAAESPADASQEDEGPADTSFSHDDLLSPGTKRMFARAAHIMRQSSDLDGVIFFDASMANAEAPPSPTTDESGDDAASNSPAIIVEESSGSTASSYGLSRQSTCRILGFADAARSSRHGSIARKDYLRLTEDSLRRLLKRHPNGKIFNMERQAADNTPMRHTSKGQMRRSTAVEAIMDVAYNARSAAIIPLWDYERQRWFAGCLCWTSDPNRQLSHGSDLLYLRAFGNSIMTELGRIDTVAVDKAKTSFIESMSHELRSPLHGILGGVEYLLDMRLDVFQTSIVNSISMCGRTLLDTVENVLEYSKINEYAGGRWRHPRAPLPAFNSNPPTNIRNLTEETVEAVFAGQSYNIASRQSAIEDDSFLSNTTSPTSPRTERPLRKAVRVIFDLPAGPCWTFAVQPGIWRRILMNVFGNALRFTDAGFVRVSLSATDLNESLSRVTLTVADSGSGMSLQYLQDGLFKAFSQENSFSSGTGLGMSIVQRLVRSIGGDISVQSKVGGGTVVKIHMNLYKCEEMVDDFASAVAAQTAGMHIAVARTIVPEDDETHKLSCDTEVQFHASLTETLQTWFGIKITTLDDLNTDGSQLVMYPSPSFNSMFKIRARQGVSIVVAMDGLEAATLRADPRVTNGLIDVVTQPCGPSKLARILQRYLSLLDSKSDAPIRPDIIASPRPNPVPYAPLVRAPPSRRRSPKIRLDTSTAPGIAPAEIIPEIYLAPASELCDSPVADFPKETAPISPPRHPLPYRPLPDRREGRPKKEKPCPPVLSTCPSKEILIVDDNPLNIRLLAAFLNKAGFVRHTSAANGLEALDLFKQDPTRWGAVLMDLSMPVMDGVTATKEIRAWERKVALLEGVQAIARTAGGDEKGAPPLDRNSKSSDSGETVKDLREGDEPNPSPVETESSAETELSAEDRESEFECDQHTSSSHTPPRRSSSPSMPSGQLTPDTVFTEADEQNPIAHASAPSHLPSPPTPMKGDSKKTKPSSSPSPSSPSHVKIIVITGLGSATARFEATNAGADVFMTKPIQFGGLMKTLKRQLGRQEANRS